MDHSELVVGELYWLRNEPGSSQHRSMVVDLSKPLNREFPRVAICDTSRCVLYVQSDLDFHQFIGVDIGGQPLSFGLELDFINDVRKFTDGIW